MKKKPLLTLCIIIMLLNCSTNETNTKNIQNEELQLRWQKENVSRAFVLTQPSISYHVFNSYTLRNLTKKEEVLFFSFTLRFSVG